MIDEPAADRVRLAYDTVAEAYAAHLPATEAEQPIDLAMIDDLVAQLAPDGTAVLDAGCGTGRISRYLADRGCDVRGVDLSPGMIAMARRDHPGIEVDVASITDLPFPPARFDAALYWYSTIHLPDADLPSVFREARRVLRPGARALVAFQAGAGIQDVGAVYRLLGFDVALTRINRRPDDVSAAAAGQGFIEEARLVRSARASERDDQAFLLLRSPGGR